MKRRALWSTLIALFALTSTAGFAEEDPTPIYDPSVVEVVPGLPCEPDPGNQFDPAHTHTYGENCKRMRIVFGPIIAKPGQNDLLIQPVVFERPMYDGYMVRFKPNMVGPFGTPPVEDLHLHHGTWLNAGGREYGSGPWLASGEEKTIVGHPNGYGLKILKDDRWLFLHMVHNATPQPTPVWVTYDIDFVDMDYAEAINPATGLPNVQNTKSIWLDVGGGKFHPEAEPYFLNPVFNTQRGFGTVNPATGLTECRYPDENCARFNSAGDISAQQGKDVSSEVEGKDYKIPNGFLGPTGTGTIVVMGGHLHNGGLRDEVTLVRNGVEKLIHISDAYYWDYNDPTRIGAPPVSWDFSMTGSSTDLGWAINVQEGDILRLNGVYETGIGSWYEQMGIVMTWVVPGRQFGYDVFDPNLTIDASGPPTTAVVPKGQDGLPLAKTCTPSATTLCVRGQVTHGHMPASGNHSGCPAQGCRPLPVAPVTGPMVTDLLIGGFTYGQADLGAIGVSGIPRVKVDTPITFHNADTADYMWHTVTRCKEPCTGPTSASYPIADGGNGSPDDNMDFDSSELGVGLAPSQKVSWTFVPDRTGVFTFYCRIHPSMRGAIEVVA